MSGHFPAPITVFIADRRPVLAAGMSALLQREGFSVVGEGCDATVAPLAAELSPDVVLVSQDLPGASGCKVAASIRKSCPKTQALLLIEMEDERILVDALEAGVAGCFSLREESPAVLFEAIRDVANGRGHWSGRLPRVTARRNLTHRERQVLRLLAEGRGTKQTAFVLGVSAKTVETHRSRLMAKLKLSDVPSLVRYAIREGVIAP